MQRTQDFVNSIQFEPPSPRLYDELPFYGVKPASVGRGRGRGRRVQGPSKAVLVTSPPGLSNPNWKPMEFDADSDAGSSCSGEEDSLAVKLHIGRGRCRFGNSLLNLGSILVTSAV